MSSSEPFNTLGGYSVGIPPELVIDETGNIVNNVNAPSSNVTANRIFANSYLYANGAPLSIGAGGSNTQVQYNNNGLLGASSAFTFNSATNLLTVTKLQVGSNANLGNVANVVILGGTNGYFLQTDGAGNLTWAPAGNGGNTGNGVPGGANTQVQFNDAGVFGGDAGFTYDKVANVLTVNEITTGNVSATDLSVNNIDANIVTANYFVGDGSNITDVAADTALVAYSVDGANVVGQVSFANVANNVAGANVSGQVNYANIANNVAGANVSGQVANALVAGTVYNSTQANITSLGNLTSLTVVGNTTLGNQVVANYFIGNLFGTANLARNVTLASQPNITSVGTLTSLTVSGNTTLGNSTTSNYFVGRLYGVANSAIVANTANIATLANTATLANAANIAGTVTVNAQPNITSVGTLTTLAVTGTANLGNVSNVKILGGTSNYVLSTDGTGNLNWIAQSAAANPIAGNNTQVQFNNNGNFGASSNFTFNSSNSYLFVGGQANFAGNVTSPVFISNIANGTAPFIVQSTTPVANLGAQTAGTVRNAAQPNITSVGTLVSLSVTGNIIANNISVNQVTGVLTTNAQPNITSLGTLSNLAVAGTANLGNVANVKITGGTNGYVLSTDGTGNLSWTAQSNGGGNATPGGSNTQVQFNSSGSFAGNPNFTWNSATNQLTVTGNTTVSNNFTAANISATNISTTSLTTTGNITAGNINAGNLLTANYISGTLTTNTQQNINYLGNIGWLNVDTSVPNSNGNISFNGSMSGVGSSSNITITGNINAGQYVEANYFVGHLATSSQPNITSLGNLSSLTVVGQTNLGNVANITITGGNANYVLSTDGAGNLSWVAQTGGGNGGTPGGLNTSIQFNDNDTFGGGSAFTWNKNSNYLYVGGNVNITGTANVNTTLNVVNLVNSGNANFNGNTNLANTTVVANRVLTVAGNINTQNSPNVNLGNIANLHISGGVNGYVLSTDGLGNLSWKNAGGSNGGGTPGGSNTQVQYNSAGTFAGDPFFTFNDVTKVVNVAGNLVANSFQMGSGIYEFSKANVYFATTNSTGSQVLLSIPANDLAAVDLTIISDDDIIRNFIKISAVVKGNVVNYAEYSTLPVNGYTGDFSVEYNPGNVVAEPSVQLVMTPQSANLMTHRMQVTTYYVLED